MKWFFKFFYYVPVFVYHFVVILMEMQIFHLDLEKVCLTRMKLFLVSQFMLGVDPLTFKGCVGDLIQAQFF